MWSDEGDCQNLFFLGFPGCTASVEQGDCLLVGVHFFTSVLVVGSSRGSSHTHVGLWGGHFTCTGYCC